MEFNFFSLFCEDLEKWIQLPYVHVTWNLERLFENCEILSEKFAKKQKAE